MRARLALLSVCGFVSLACGGLFVSDSDHAMLGEALQSAEPENAVNLFVLGGAEVGLVNGRCAQCVEPFTMASAEMRQKLGANALMETSCLCPSTCASELLDELATLEAAARMARVGQACDADGPDPIFVDGLEALRSHTDVVDYAMVRMMAEAMQGSDALPGMREGLAAGLAIRGPQRTDATDELVVTGHEADAFEALAPVLVACRAGLEHRFVVRPDGTIAAARGPTCHALDALRLPGDGWRVVEAAWSAAGIAAYMGIGDAPVDGTPDDPPVEAPAPTPAPADELKRATTSAGSPTVKGSMPAQVIEKTLRRQIRAFGACYERELLKNPDLKGTVATQFVIAADGHVASATVSQGIDPTVDACVQGRFQRMRFPQPSGGGSVVVTYPLVFSSRAPIE